MITPAKYPLVLRLFHWTMSILIIGMIILGFLMTQVLDDKPYTGALFLWHKSFGVLILMLIALRICARITLNHAVPPVLGTLPRYERIGSIIGHKLLYLLMVVVPLSGYLMSSAYPKSSGIAFFGLPLPDALPKSEWLSQIFTGIHNVAAYCLAAVVVIHVAAVIKHRFFDAPDQDVLKRML